MNNTVQDPKKEGSLLILCKVHLFSKKAKLQRNYGIRLRILMKNQGSLYSLKKIMFTTSEKKVHFYSVKSKTAKNL